MSKIAWIGLGVMGFPMAGHLKTRGHDLVVFNRTRAKAEAWVARFGGRLAATPAEAADGAEFVFTCVGNDDDLREVTLGRAWRLRRARARRDLRRSHHRLRQYRPRASPSGQGPRRRRARCAGVGRPVGRRERHPHGDGRRRRGGFPARRAGDRRLCPHDQSDRPVGRGPAHQDGQPDLHRRPHRRPGRGAAFRHPRRPRHRKGHRHHRQGRGPVLADGQSLADHDRAASSISASPSTGCARISRWCSRRRGATAPSFP